MGLAGGGFCNMFTHYRSSPRFIGRSCTNISLPLSAIQKQSSFKVLSPYLQLIIDPLNLLYLRSLSEKRSVEAIWPRPFGDL